jgi:lipopolysaccharide export system protein LptC
MDRADKYSRLVLWLKVTLPLLALGILSTLFFVAETLDPDAAIPYAEVDVERILREQGMTAPTFGGVTSDGVEIALTASAVRPGQDRASTLTAGALAAKLNLAGRGQLAIDAPQGIIDTESGLATLQGGAVLESSTGFRVETDRIMTSYLEASAVAEGEVRATGPAGTLTAGAMELTKRQDDTPGYLLVFKSGVRLLYEPQP